MNIAASMPGQPELRSELVGALSSNPSREPPRPSRREAEGCRATPRSSESGSGACAHEAEIDQQDRAERSYEISDDELDGLLEEAIREIEAAWSSGTPAQRKAVNWKFFHEIETRKAGVAKVPHSGAWGSLDVFDGPAFEWTMPRPL